MRTVIGLQGRYHPELRYARRLIAEGRIGRVIGTTMIGSGMVRGLQTTRAHAYRYDRTQGATPLTAAALHAIDTLNATHGEFTHHSSNLVLGRQEVTVAEDGSALPVTAADQISLIGTLEGGAAASVFYRGGTSRADNFRWEINGTDGDLVLTADWGTRRSPTSPCRQASVTTTPSPRSRYPPNTAPTSPRNSRVPPETWPRSTRTRPATRVTAPTPSRTSPTP
ncbi:Gfo/Idh/MocA family protein [Streptomyces sp. 900105755]